ncbi:cytochrome P450 family protein [Streptomyces rhizosphaericus]|uniref:hypothetical protein n=1 Tax=Streptomyces rhizosphaericus TaxID=114699 RepID=UPI0036403617
MTLPDAIEHVLWNEPPLTVVPGRWATGDTELGGQRIKAGDMLLLGLAAGNVDPAIRPDIAAPMYGNRSHLAFSGGPHECPGQDIGRAITDTAIDTLLLRLPDLRLAVDETELTWLSSWISRHLVELPVEFMPRRPEPDIMDLPVEALLSPGSGCRRWPRRRRPRSRPVPRGQRRRPPGASRGGWRYGGGCWAGPRDPLRSGPPPGRTQPRATTTPTVSSPSTTQLNQSQPLLPRATV